MIKYALYECLQSSREILYMGQLKSTGVTKGMTMAAKGTIVRGITISQYAFYALAAGVPARISGWVCACDLKLRWINEETTYVSDDRFLKTMTGIVKLGDYRAVEKTGVGAQRHEIVATPHTLTV